MTRIHPGDIIRINPHGDVIPLIESMEYSESTNGPGARQRYHVKDINGPPDMVLVVAAQANGIPRVGDLLFGSHGPAVSRVTAALVAQSKTQAIVTVTWGPIPGGTGGPIEPPILDGDATIDVSSTV